MSAPSDPQLTPVPRAGVAGGLSLAWLVLLAWGSAAQVVRLDDHHRRPAAFALLAVAELSSVLALVRHRDHSRSAVPGLGGMALAGGVLAAFAPLAMVFPAVAALSASIRWRIQVAALVGAVGWLAMAVAELVEGPSLAVVVGGLAAVLGGVLVGVSRRQVAERAEQAARAEVAAARAELERERAELLDERNHLAREIHDVLAHTLAALSLQLEAFWTVVDAEPDTSPEVLEQLDRTGRLVREGLDEARRAVRALRDDAPPLDEQLAGLTADHHAGFSVAGRPGPIPAEVALGLYRVVQEALTNVMKHATGASTTVGLQYGPGCVSVVIDDTGGPGDPALDGSGGGYGLRGLAERLALLGGRLETGPRAGGWRVSASVPLPSSARRAATRADPVAT